MTTNGIIFLFTIHISGPLLVALSFRFPSRGIKEYLEKYLVFFCDFYLFIYFYLQYFNNWLTLHISRLPIYNTLRYLLQKSQVMHNILKTNSLLYKMKKIDSPIRLFCPDTVQSISHLFVRC